MKQSTIITAYNALTALSQNRFPVKDAYTIHKLRQSLASQYEFQRDEERKLIEQYHVEVHEGGKIHFPSVADAKGFTAALGALGELEVDINVEKPTITMPESVEISPADLDALEGFLNIIFA